MSEELKISEHIYNNAPCGKQSNFADFQSLEEVFSSIPQDVQKLWPLDLSDKGYKTRYEQAQIGSEQLGFVQNVLLKAKVFNDQESYLLKFKLSFLDDKLVFDYDSILQKKGSGNNFANAIMHRSQEFLTGYDNTRSQLSKGDFSEINFQASSTTQSVPILSGGYVWANQGFDFKSKSDLLEMRKSFKAFTHQYGVEISDKDICRFNKPCHFAAFGCGVQGQDSQGRKVHLGKAFMLKKSWMASWKTSQPQAEEKRYAAAYNQRGIVSSSRRRKAVLKLSKAYQSLLRKYYEHYAPKQTKISKFEAYKRLAVKRFKQLIGITR